MQLLRVKYILIFFVFLSQLANAQLFLSPDGDDNNAGTKESPLASLTGARNLIRKYKKEAKHDTTFVITIKGGNYILDKPFILSSEDSGTPEYPVIYKAEPGEKPVFVGGIKVKGFIVNDNGIWEADVSNIVSDTLHPGQLYVNGRRAVLARTPNSGFLKIGGVREVVIEKGNGRYPARARQILSFDKKNFQPLIGISGVDLQTVRFKAFHKWDFTMRYIDKIDKDSMRIITSGQGMKPWNPLRKGTRIVFENYSAALDTAGEWFINNNNFLYYLPQQGETPQNSEVVIPVAHSFVVIKGDTANNRFVENIRFEGLKFSFCNYSVSKSGFEPNQAAISVGASVEIEGARNISFVNCAITHTGQHAIWFGMACNNCSVEHCFLNDLGGGGIYLGDTRPLKGKGHTSHITLNNNIIQTGGREFPPAVGVWTGHSSDNIITHNDIADFYYTGISAGWIWGYKPSLGKRNTISYNHIHHIGWDLLSDMAAVYTLGKSEGTIVSNNVIHHIHAYSYGGWGLYPDEGTSGILMENNLVYSTKTGGFHQHYGENNIIRNNIFGFAKLYQAQCTRVEDHLSFTFKNNIIIFDTGQVLNGAWAKIKIVMDSNIYWNTASDKYDFSGMTFHEWLKTTGHDKHSLITNPMFNNPEKFDFEFQNTKTVQKIGFQPFDISKAGVYGDEKWKEKSHLPEQVIREFDEVVRKNVGGR